MGMEGRPYTRRKEAEAKPLDRPERLWSQSRQPVSRKAAVDATILRAISSQLSALQFQKLTAES
jgi:hypothetical protein